MCLYECLNVIHCITLLSCLIKKNSTSKYMYDALIHTSNWLVYHMLDCLGEKYIWLYITHNDTFLHAFELLFSKFLWLLNNPNMLFVRRHYSKWPTILQEFFGTSNFVPIIHSWKSFTIICCSWKVITCSTQCQLFNQEPSKLSQLNITVISHESPGISNHCELVCSTACSAEHKEDIKPLYCCLLLFESNGHWWICLWNAQLCGKSSNVTACSAEHKEDIKPLYCCLSLFESNGHWWICLWNAQLCGKSSNVTACSAEHKEDIKPLYCCLLLFESNGHWWICLWNAQLCGKSSNVTLFSWSDQAFSGLYCDRR